MHRRTFFLSLGALVLAGASSAACAPLTAYKEAAAYSAEHSGVSFLVMEKGRVVAEQYADGNADQAFELASGTKSFWGLAVAAAAQDGLLKLDELVADTVSEWKSDQCKAAIQVRHLLSLTSGLEPGRMGRPAEYAQAIQAACSTAPGQVFAYGPNSYQCLGEFLRRKLGDPLAYLEKRLLSPLTIRYGSWKRSGDGMPHMPSGAALSARNWALLGEFVRQGGGPLLSRDSLAACFQGTKANPSYGLTWWLNRKVDAGLREAIPMLARETEDLTDLKGIPADLVFAAGAGKQRLFVSQEAGLVVVRQSDKLRSRGYSDREFLQRVFS